jgi:outer membrane biosynthesis protein TonB
MGAGCGKAPDDSKATSEIQSRMSQDSGLSGKPITVQTEGGVVTLSGNVDNDAQRTAAARYASSVPGIKQVVNNLQIVTPEAKPAPALEAAAQPAPAPEPTPTPAPKPAPKPAAKPKRAAAMHAKHKPAPAEVAEKSQEPMEKAAEPERHAPMTSDPATHDSAAMHDATPPAPVAPPPPQKVTIAAGTTMAIRLVDPVDSETVQPGETFRATLDSPLSVDGEVVIPHGYDVQGHVVDVKSAGKFAGQSLLILQLDRISVGHKSYNIQTDQYKREGSSRGKNTAAKVGTGAAIGAIIGGIAGGGKGAAIGAAAGGGVGGGVQAATKGQQIKLPSETVLNFTLQSPLTVTPATGGPSPDRPKLDTPQQQSQ